MAQELFDKANDPKSIKIIYGAGHNDIFTVAGHAVDLEIERSIMPPAVAPAAAISAK
jgi:fermentation-respiration switch protein FrsA (DUF1100 family)